MRINIPSSPLTSNCANGDVPALIPTLSADTSTNNVSESTARSFVTVTVLLKVAAPSTSNWELAPTIFNVPVMLSPAFSTFSDAAPVRSAVIVLAEKLPELSRITAVETTLAELNCTLPSFQIFWPRIVIASALATCTFREPDPSVPLPPVATIATLKFAANTELLKKIPGDDPIPSFLPRFNFAVPLSLSNSAIVEVFWSSKLKESKLTLLLAVPTWTALPTVVKLPEIRRPTRIVKSSVLSLVSSLIIMLLRTKSPAAWELAS